MNLKSNTKFKGSHVLDDSMDAPSFYEMPEFETKFTHLELCQIAFKWLKNKCPIRCSVVFMEMTTQAMETPDAIGFTGMYSILIECKTSRSDFLADKKKFFRVHPEQGVGDFRFYMCPEGVIKTEDVPDKWGLIWVDRKGKCIQVKQILTGNIGCAHDSRFLEKNIASERYLLYSALRRFCETSPNYFYKYE